MRRRRKHALFDLFQNASEIFHLEQFNIFKLCLKLFTPYLMFKLFYWCSTKLIGTVIRRTIQLILIIGNL